MGMRFSEAVAIRARYPTHYLNPLRPEVRQAYDRYRAEHRLGAADKLRDGKLADMERQFLYLLPAYIWQRGKQPRTFLNLGNEEIRAAWLRRFLCSVPDQAAINAFQLDFAQSVVGGYLCHPDCQLPADGSPSPGEEAATA